MFPIWVNDGSSPPPDSDIYYVVAKEGIFLKKKLGMFESMAPVDKISILEPMESQAKMFVRRIPAKQTGQIVNFFREVYKLHRAEAIVILHYNPDTKKYKIEVPNQEVSPGTAVYVSDLQYEGFVRVGTAHSHAGMGAFHSGTDVHDEEGWDGVHFTFGNMNSSQFSIACSLVANGSRFVVDPAEYLNGVRLIEYEDSAVKPIFQVNHASNAAQKPRTKLGYILFPKFETVGYSKLWIKRVGKKKHQWGAGRGRHYGQTFLPGISAGGIENMDHQIPFSIKPGQSYTEALVNYADKNNDHPCNSCPFKEHRMELLIEEHFDDLESFIEVDETQATKEGDAEMTVLNSDVPEHLKQEGFSEKSGS